MTQEEFTATKQQLLALVAREGGYTFPEMVGECNSVFELYLMTHIILWADPVDLNELELTDEQAKVVYAIYRKLSSGDDERVRRSRGI